jgi:hypothetical protein
MSDVTELAAAVGIELEADMAAEVAALLQSYLLNGNLVLQTLAEIGSPPPAPVYDAGA